MDGQEGVLDAMQRQVITSVNQVRLASAAHAACMMHKSMLHWLSTRGQTSLVQFKSMCKRLLWVPRSGRSSRSQSGPAQLLLSDTQVCLA